MRKLRGYGAGTTKMDILETIKDGKMRRCRIMDNHSLNIENDATEIKWILYGKEANKVKIRYQLNNRFIHYFTYLEENDD